MAMRRTRIALGWGKGAIHPNGSNFRRNSRYDVVARVRRLCEWGLLKERPKWLEWAERVPPMENHNLNLQVRKIRNPYPQMVEFLLKKYPDLRFQDCYVDGNDWSVGNDTFRDDHPVMQFVARQLDFMNQGLSKKEAFKKAESLFTERREYLEREQKVMMAMAMDSGLSPMFATGGAYLQAEKARAEVAHLQTIHRHLRQLKQDKQAGEKGGKRSVPERRMAERSKGKEAERDRLNAVGNVGSTPLEEMVAHEDEMLAEATFKTEASQDAVVAPVISDQEAMDSLIAEEGGDARTTREAQAPSASERPAAAAVPDIEDTASRGAPELSPPKPEDIISVAASRRRSGDRERKVSAKGLSDMLRGGRGVVGEDKEEDFLDDAAARRSRRRKGKGNIFDDDD